jgi:hypothetical protein
MIRDTVEDLLKLCALAAVFICIYYGGSILEAAILAARGVQP